MSFIDPVQRHIRILPFLQTDTHALTCVNNTGINLIGTLYNLNEGSCDDDNVGLKMIDMMFDSLHIDEVCKYESYSCELFRLFKCLTCKYSFPEQKL